MEHMYKCIFHLCRGFEDPLVPGFLLVGDHGLSEHVPDGGLHGLQQVVEPRLHLAHTHARLVEVDIFAVLAPHPQSLVAGLLVFTLTKLEASHAVKQLGQMTRHLLIQKKHFNIHVFNER